MRARYWSNTAFADKLRSLAGISKQPVSATMEGWNDYEKQAKATAPFTYALVESLDKIQTAVFWVPDKFDAMVYYVSNVKNSTHVLLTRTKRGQWQDLVAKIPDALMLSVIDFVEKECFWMNIMSTEELGLLKDYANQNYLMRKLFPIHINESIRGSEGIKWLRWQIEASQGASAEYYEPIIAAYKFAKERYFKFDAWEESGYNEAERAGLFESPLFSTSKERGSFYSKIRVLEDEFDEQVTLHCSNIVKYRKGLWT